MTNGSERIAEHPTGTATWLPVVGYEGLYEVSDDGRVRSIRAGKVLSPAPNPHGKLHVSLSRDGRRITKAVHRLVARAFLGPTDLPLVRHLNDDPSDNRLANLAYGTSSDNALDSVRNGTHAWATKTHCPKGHPYDEANTILKAGGRRNCRECHREQARQWARTHRAVEVEDQ